MEELFIGIQSLFRADSEYRFFDIRAAGQYYQIKISCKLWANAEIKFNLLEKLREEQKRLQSDLVIFSLQNEM